MNISVQQLKQLISKIEKLNEEKQEVQECISEAYREAKTLGFDTKILRKVIAMRKKRADELAEEQELVQIYFNAINGNENE